MKKEAGPVLRAEQDAVETEESHRSGEIAGT